MKIQILASGSKGNATYLSFDDKELLIDFGISMKQMRLRLAEKGSTLEKLDGILITHEHSDHVKGLTSLYQKYHMPIYLTMGTYKNLSNEILMSIPEDAFHYIRFNEPFAFGTSEILPFMTFHDALEPTGYKITENGKSIVYMTDTGYFPEHQYEIIQNANLYIIESNHEPDMLLDSDRPWHLKRRILDDKGHLSNQDSAYIMVKVIGENTKEIILAHLSEDCNTEDCALDAFQKVFSNQGLSLENVSLKCAKQHESMEVIVL